MPIIEVRPGEGGEDAAAFAFELAAALTAYCTRNGWRPTAGASPDSRLLIVKVSQDAAIEPLSRFTGTHRIQRIPVNDKRGRRQTSTATVIVLADEKTSQVQVADQDCRVDYFRGSGPGGQHRNKTSSAVRLTHLPTGIVITRLSGRSQISNLADAKAELEARLNDAASKDGAGDRNATRSKQVASPERSAKAFTHNTQRNEVRCHRTGQAWQLRAFAQGRLD